MDMQRKIGHVGAMGRKTFAILLTEAALVVLSLVLPVMFPSIDPSTAYWIAAVCAMVLVAGGMIYWWPSKQLEASALTQNEDNAKGGRNIITHGQTGGFNNSGDINFYAEDNSLKRRLKNILAEADPRINSAIDGGEKIIQFRLTRAQFTRFERLLAEPGSAEFFDKVDRGPSIYGSLINNGSLGPITAEHEQVPIVARVNLSLRD